MSFLSTAQLCATLKLSRSRINQFRFGYTKGSERIAPDPTFPQPRKLGKGRSARVLWREAEVLAWVDSKAGV